MQGLNVRLESAWQNTMRSDIRFSGKAVTLKHRSARGKAKRNANNFPRGSQLFTHEMRMTWAGLRMPLLMWSVSFVLAFSAFTYFYLAEHETQLILMKLYADFWSFVDLDPNKIINLKLPSGETVQGAMAWVPDHPAVRLAWAKAGQIFLGSFLTASFICVPLSVWFLDLQHDEAGAGDGSRCLRSVSRRAVNCLAA